MNWIDKIKEERVKPTTRETCTLGTCVHNSVNRLVCRYPEGKNCIWHIDNDFFSDKRRNYYKRSW